MWANGLPAAIAEARPEAEDAAERVDVTSKTFDALLDASESDVEAGRCDRDRAPRTLAAIWASVVSCPWPCGIEPSGPVVYGLRGSDRSAAFSGVDRVVQARHTGR